MRKGIAIVATLFLLIPVCGFADIKEVVSEGQYDMGDGETPGVAESRALLNAKRMALEQAGTYVESYSKVHNFQLVEDEVRVLTAGTVAVTVLDKKRTIVGAGIRFWVKIRARVQLDQMEALAKVVKDRSIVEDFKKIQQAYDQNQQEMDRLRKALAVVQEAVARKDLEARVAAEEKRFQANGWFETGLRHTIGREDDKAIEAYTRAIALNPDHLEAYNYRGFAYYNRGTFTGDPAQHALAVQDFRKVVALKPGTYSAHLAQASIHVYEKEPDKALEEVNRAIALNPAETLAYGLRGFIHMDGKVKDPDKVIADSGRVIDQGGLWSPIAYSNRGVAWLFEKKKYDLALDDFNRAIALTPLNAPAYLGRGIALAYKGQWDRALEDISRSIALNPNVSQAYDLRGAVYAQMGNPRAIADFQKACDMGLEQGCSHWKQALQHFKITGGK